ncbi:MAG TPA: hypothetical protein VH834_18280 [Solirubrobacteraceae bacterium]
MAEDDRREDDERQDDERQDDERDDDRREDDRRGADDRPQTLEAAQERITALERELGETRQQAIKRRTRVQALERELATEREKGMDEQQRAVEQARREEREKLEGEHRSERVRGSVLLAAATKLRDPQDAVRYIDLEALGQHEDGELDKAAGRAVEELLEKREYLAAGGEETPTGARSPGPRRRQAAGTRTGEAGVNERIRKSLRR